MSSNYKKVLAVVLSAVLLLAMTAVAYATQDGFLKGNQAEGTTVEEEDEPIVDPVVPVEPEEDTTDEDEPIVDPAPVEPVDDDEDATEAATSESEVIEGTAYLLGDVNVDGFVRSNDARWVLRMAAGLPLTDLETPNMAISEIAADYNRNGVIKANDARFILRVSADLDVTFGKETDPEADTTAVYDAAECLEWTFYYAD